MDTWIWAVIAAGAVIVVALIALAILRRRRTRRLRSQFGTEYDHVIDVRGSRRKAEGDLADRSKRRDAIDLRTLPAITGERYAASWRDIQTRFVDTPADAVREAHGLLDSLLREVGYPVDQ